MQADQADAVLHQGVNLFKAVALEQRMARAAIAVNDHSRRAFESLVRVRRPAVAVNRRNHPRHIIQTGLQ
jgi:hypothetical protein